MAKRAKRSGQVAAPASVQAPLPPAPRQTARQHFQAFFHELRARFVEREDAIDQIALALLAKEHVLMTGPPGTAKSALSSTVLQNIVDRDTRVPSVFARQFTESTVQTDLIGPLDFKTLMESGRSEHFTDEGMLGAVHAFLDEVLDGRDMLLRTTLNVLHERELKQGTKTTRGAIESALMTTNRYLCEVMEQSRETLLAFVDRIAFVSFVPKSFAVADNLVSVLNRQLGPKRRVPMPPLTIQDVDRLQAMVEMVRFSEPVARELVSLLARLESELAAATRADPRFVPTRYLSTRTVVRTAHVLRAAVVYDWVMNDGARPLAVRAADFRTLRLTLLLGGPALEYVAGLVQREPDAREKRQLSIYQTERQIFERVVAELKVDAIPVEPPPEPLPSLAALRELGLVEQIAASEKLLALSESGGSAGLLAKEQLEAATDVLAQRVLSQAMRAGIGDVVGEAEVSDLERIAALLDRAQPDAQKLASVLRTRALEVLEAEVGVALTTTSAMMREAVAGRLSVADAQRHTKERLERLSERQRLKSALIAGGASVPPESEERWRHATARVLEEVVQIWELGFDGHLDATLSSLGNANQPLQVVLSALAGPLSEMRECGRVFEPMGYDASCVAARVVDQKLLPFIEQAFRQSTYSTREGVADAIEKLLQKLDEADAHWAVSSKALLEWAARALLEAEPGPKRKQKRKLSYEGYREFRKQQPTSALAHCLVEVCTHIALAAPELRAGRPPSVNLVREQLATLPTALAEQLAAEDVRRVQETLAFFREWWSVLTSRELGAEQQLQGVLDTRFHALLDEERALLRFTLEAQLLGELFPFAAGSIVELCTELQAFSQGVQSHIHGLLHARSLALRDGKS